MSARLILAAFLLDKGVEFKIGLSTLTGYLPATPFLDFR
jgi:hypothetical protein